MPQLWTITDLTSTQVLAVSFPTPSSGSHPKDNGWAWDATKQKAWQIPAVPDLMSQKWNGTAWVDDLDSIKSDLISTIKTESERHKMINATPGSYKKTEYAEKSREVMAWDALGSTTVQILDIVLGLTTGERWARFPFAMADSEAFGDGIDKAIARFRVGMNGATINAKVAGVEAAVCDKIKKATTAAAARAAAAAVVWPV